MGATAHIDITINILRVFVVILFDNPPVNTSVTSSLFAFIYIFFSFDVFSAYAAMIIVQTLYICSTQFTHINLKTNAHLVYYTYLHRRRRASLSLACKTRARWNYLTSRHHHILCASPSHPSKSTPTFFYPVEGYVGADIYRNTAAVASTKSLCTIAKILLNIYEFVRVGCVWLCVCVRAAVWFCVE